MANLTFDQLPAAVSVDGTETLPIMQGGVSKRTTLAAAGFNSSYTRAQIDALESGGTLTLNAWYVASDTGAMGLATATNVMAWIDFDALALALENGIATYAAGEIEKLAGIPNIAPLLALAEVNAYPRPFTLYQQSGGPAVTQPAATWTAPTASNNGSGKLRLTTVGGSGGVHGLSTLGNSIYVGFATSGSGLHEIANVVDTKTLDFTTDFADVSGAVTVYLVGTPSKAQDNFATIPGGTMGPNGRVDTQFIGRMTASTTNKAVELHIGGSYTAEAAWAGAADALGFAEFRTINLNDEASQITTTGRYNGSNATIATTKDTTADVALSWWVKVLAADMFVRFDQTRVTLIPGL